ncbi:inner membrane protein [Escherichia coli]|uniref:Inner membrane protein n=1 Tax=Escherichia coli TaxID=562 RepID=A0A2X1NZY0_ECOLX|nr:inner membrane protein [Escherichia coli]
MRNASDNIRNAMNMLMEVALLVGSIFAAIKMAGYTGFSIAVAIYFLNESWAVRYRKWRHRSWQ